MVFDIQHQLECLLLLVLPLKQKPFAPRYCAEVYLKANKTRGQ